VRGGNGLAGEPGHMTVDPDGPPCPCGRQACWERYASGSGLARLAREAAIAGRVNAVVERAGGDPEDVKGEHLTAAAREGDPGALAVVDQFGWWVALGLANLVNILDPSVVVIGGGLVSEGDLLLDPTRRAFTRHVLAPEHRPEVAIRAAELGERAGAIGAAMVAADRL
jgi:glucokinase